MKVGLYSIKTVISHLTIKKLDHCVVFLFTEHDFPKVRDKVVWKDREYDCGPIVDTDTSTGIFCGCPFLACSGGQDCTGNSLHCYIVNKDYNYLDMKDEDCDCN